MLRGEDLISYTAAPFSRMADRMAACAGGEFGGAMVLIAPDGKTVEFLLTNPAGSSAAGLVSFWAFVQSLIKDAFDEYQASQTGMPGQLGFPRR
jgi:homoaconitase/3-isopropylmalate dehydratase large subunit